MNSLEKPASRGTFHRALWLFAATGSLAVPGHRLAGQEIVIRPDDGSIQSVSPGSNRTFPIVVDMGGAAGQNIAALSVELSWNIEHLAFQSVAAGTFGNVEFNETGTAAGELQIGLFNATGTTATFTLASVTLQGVANGLTLLDVKVTASGTEESGDLADVTFENPTFVCVGIPGTFGDVDGSGAIDILDAMEIALFAAALPVTDDTRLQGLGDVTADGTINIIDAQQVARFAIDLSTIGRIGEESQGCSTPSLSVLAGDGQSTVVGLKLTEPLLVKVADESGNPIERAPVRWTVTGGGGSVGTPISLTDRDGIAAVEWTVGPTDGLNTVDVGATWRDGTLELSSQGVALTGGFISGQVTVMHRPINPASIDSLESAAPSGPSMIADRPEYTERDLIVTFHAAPIGAPPMGSAAAASSFSVQSVSTAMRQVLATHERPGLVRTTGISPVIIAARIEVADPATIDSVADALRSDPAVASVERNFFAYADVLRPLLEVPVDPVVPNDPDYVWQAWHYAMIDLPEAWSITTGDASVLVAVIDDGIRFDHPGIAANLTTDGYDFVTDQIQVPFCTGGTIELSADGDGYDPDPTNPFFAIRGSDGCIVGPAPDGNHGLHVAGTVGAAGNDGIGGTGVNWNVSIRPVRALGIAGGTSYDIAQAVLYAAGLPADNGAGGTVQAATGAPIINMSLGGPNPSEVGQNAVISASAAGSLIIAAAGNNANTEPNYPGAYEETMGVSAVGPDGVLASYSTYGSMVDIAAPGGDLQDGDETFAVFSTAWNYVDAQPIWSSKIWNGTSMAAPHVAGVAALLLAAEPGLTRQQLWDRLVNFAVDAGPPGFDEKYGNGILNAWNSLTQTPNLPVGDLHALLYDASTGSLLQTVPIGAGGGFQFDQTAVGSFWVYAGEDDSGDGMLGIPGRRWGALGGVTSPMVIDVTGPSTHDASFAFGFPAGSAVGDQTNPHQLIMGTSFLDFFESGGEWIRFEVTAAGSYTVETFPWDGVCGYAVEAATFFYLRAGVDMIASSNLNAANCSTVTMDLTPGTHFVELYLDGSDGRRYGIQVKQNP